MKRATRRYAEYRCTLYFAHSSTKYLLNAYYTQARLSTQRAWASSSTAPAPVQLTVYCTVQTADKAMVNVHIKLAPFTTNLPEP